MAATPPAEQLSTLQYLISGVVFAVSAVIAAFGYFKLGKKDEAATSTAGIIGATLHDNGSLIANTRAVIALTDQVEVLASEIRELNRENGRTRDAVRESGDGLRHMTERLTELIRRLAELTRDSRDHRPM